MQSKPIEEAIRFTPRDYKDVFNDPNIRVGFELEFVANHRAYPEVTAPMVYKLKWLWENPYHFPDFFTIDENTVAAVYEKWLKRYAKTKENYLDEPTAEDVESNWLLLVCLSNCDVNFRKAFADGVFESSSTRIQFIIDTIKKNFHILQWLETHWPDGHGYPLKKYWSVIHAQPKYGWANEAKTEFMGDPSKNSVSSSLVRFRVDHAITNDLFQSLHINTRKTTGWQIENDISIKPENDNDLGIELISPPLPVNQCLAELKKLFDWMVARGHYTNSSCGFHVGVSYGKKRTMHKINRVKLLMLLGEDYLLREFNRTMSEWTVSHVDRIAKQLQNSNIDSREIQELVRIVDKKVDLTKDRTVNFGKLEHGYLEFRIMGGKDYHQQWEKVHNTMLRYAFVLKYSLDPDAYNDAYRAELGRLIAQSIEQVKPIYPDLATKYIVQDIYGDYGKKQALSRLSKCDAAGVIGDKNSIMKYLPTIINLVYDTYSVKNSAELPQGVKIALKIKLKKWNITSQDVNKILQEHGFRKSERMLYVDFVKNLDV
jgi:Putative amidoligase enzyme